MILSAKCKISLDAERKEKVIEALMYGQSLKTTSLVLAELYEKIRETERDVFLTLTELITIKELLRLKAASLLGEGEFYQVFSYAGLAESFQMVEKFLEEKQERVLH